MAATTAGQGLEIPFKNALGVPSSLIRFAALILPCILASIIAAAVRPGSITALCFVIPLLVLLGDLWPRRGERRVQFQSVLALAAILGMALEPGWLNIVMSWLLLLALAIEARSAGVHAATAALRAVTWSVAASPFGIAFATISTMLSLPVKPFHLIRVPFSSFVLPVVAVLVFVPLLAAANPVIEQFLLSIDVLHPLAMIDRFLISLFSFETVIFALAMLMIWPVLRGHNAAHASSHSDVAPAPLWHALFFKPFAVVATLLILNMMFAVENILDLRHLWIEPAQSGSYHHASYVHRGAYTLIFTAALAGLLMLTALRKGTATEASWLVRQCVYVFVAQNLLLVASSVQRTLLYIDAYGWTEWRLSGLAWMALVFFGLLTIFWRVIRNRDSRWLFNANILAATALLVGFSIWNMQGFIAQKNVERALASSMPALDFQYMRQLSLNALPALKNYQAGLQTQVAGQGSSMLAMEQSRAAFDIRILMQTLDRQQADWRSWTLSHTGMVESGVAHVLD